MSGAIVGRIAQLWRSPVKSLGGERLESAGVAPRGLSADRLWSIRDLDHDLTGTARPPA